MTRSPILVILLFAILHSFGIATSTKANPPPVAKPLMQLPTEFQSCLDGCTTPNRVVGAIEASAPSTRRSSPLSRQMSAESTTEVLYTAVPAGSASDPIVTTPPRTGVGVSIKSFGAVGDGIHDDTPAIQTAIDYAYSNNLHDIFCPAGRYLTSRTIYLDPPGNLRSNFSHPTMFDFSLAFVGQDRGIGNNDVHAGGCRIRPNFNNGIAFIIGPGQHMKVSGIAVVSSAGGYRGNLPASGVGIGIAGGNGGSHHTLIENTDVWNFYALYQTNSNSACCHADSNSFHNISGTNGYYGLQLTGTQSDINRVEEPILSATVGISDIFSKQVTVTGGNISATSGVSGSFEISGISGLKPAADGGFTFRAVVASPDVHFPNVYNSFAIVTRHFGVIPLTLNSWAAGTNTGTFEVTPAWATAHFGRVDLSNAQNTDLASEIAVVTTIYAVERVIVVEGVGVSLEGVHVENPNACQTLYYLTSVWRGASRSSLKNLFLNSDPARPDFSPSHGPTPGQLAQFYCQQVFPFIGQNVSSSADRLDVDGGDYGQSAMGTASAPLLFEFFPGRTISARGLSGLAAINERVFDLNWYSYTELGGFGQIDTQANGAGDWDNNYFLPHGLTDPAAWPSSCGVACYVTQGHLTVPYRGYRPAQGQEPNLSPDIYAYVSGKLGNLGTYPPIDCETVYRSVAWNSGTLVHVHLRSASCPGYSWGQNLTDALVGETVTWSYKGQSTMLYLDAKTLSWMFPGLGLTIPGSFKGDSYIVTGVYPQLGYVTVMDVTRAVRGNPNAVGAPLQGDLHTVYSCSSGCAIGQAAYQWTAY
jgi:hypothetical protein